MVKCPNRTVLREALDAFRDEMRRFIVRGMRRMGKPTEKAIYDSLERNQANQFQTNRRNGRTLESAIDIGDFPDIIGKNYQYVFGQQFRGDMKVVQSLLHIIRHARNEVVHPSDTDVETEYTRVILYHIIEVLESIDAPEAKASVERLHDTLSTEQALASLQNKNTGSAPEQRHSQTDAPPSPSRSPSILRFIVTMPDGEKIERDTIAKTFVAVIEVLGIEKVRTCNIKRFYVPIVDTVKHLKHTQVQSGPYYILTAQDRHDKRRDLLKIADALGVELKIEMPPKNEVV